MKRSRASLSAQHLNRPPHPSPHGTFMWEAFAEEKEPSESADGSAAEAAKEETNVSRRQSAAKLLKASEIVQPVMEEGD